MVTSVWVAWLITHLWTSKHCLNLVSWVCSKLCSFFGLVELSKWWLLQQWSDFKIWVPHILFWILEIILVDLYRLAYLFFLLSVMVKLIKLKGMTKIDNSQCYAFSLVIWASNTLRNVLWNQVIVESMIIICTQTSVIYFSFFSVILLVWLNLFAQFQAGIEISKLFLKEGNTVCGFTNLKLEELLLFFVILLNCTKIHIKFLSLHFLFILLGLPQSFNVLEVLSWSLILSDNC